MSINFETRQLLINIIRLNLKTEIEYYTHPKVQTTAHAVGVADKNSWTQDFIESKIIKSSPLKGDRFVEFERTLTALYSFLIMHLDFKEAYKAFTAAQRNNSEIKENEILSEASFKKIFDRTQSIINKDKDSSSVLIYLIVYSDLGKSPRLKELLVKLMEKTKINIDLSLDPDDLITEILTKLSDEQIAEILPSFKKLSPNAKKMLKEIYPLMKPCYGHIHFGERLQETEETTGEELAKIDAERRDHSLNLAYLAQFFDGAGAQGQRNIAGSVTCTEDFAKGYGLMYDALQKLKASIDTGKSIKEAATISSNYYRNQRASWLGFDDPSSPKQQLLTRLGCMIRGFSPEFGKILKEEFEKLKPAYQKLLLDELGSNDKGLETWTKLHYVATTPQNLSRKSFAENKIREGISKSLQGLVCFSMMVKKIETEFPNYVTDKKRVISFGEFAFHATNNPESFNPDKFVVSDYTFDPKLNKIVKMPKVSQELKEEKTPQKNRWASYAEWGFKMGTTAGTTLSTLYAAHAVFRQNKQKEFTQPTPKTAPLPPSVTPSSKL